MIGRLERGLAAFIQSLILDCDRANILLLSSPHQFLRKQVSIEHPLNLMNRMFNLPASRRPSPWRFFTS